MHKVSVYGKALVHLRNELNPISLLEIILLFQHFLEGPPRLHLKCHQIIQKYNTSFYCICHLSL